MSQANEISTIRNLIKKRKVIEASITSSHGELSHAFVSFSHSRMV
jgi:hypothetical protein